MTASDACRSLLTSLASSRCSLPTEESTGGGVRDTTYRWCSITPQCSQCEKDSVALEKIVDLHV